MQSDFKGINEARLRAMWPKNAPRHSKKCELHGRHTPSTPRLSKGAEAYAFSALGEVAYALEDGYLALQKKKKKKIQKT